MVYRVKVSSKVILNADKLRSYKNVVEAYLFVR